MRLLALAVCALLALPLLGVLGAWFVPQEGSLELLRHQFTTVMPGYALSSLWLALGVAVGVTLLGYFLGNVPFVKNNLELMILLIVFLSILPGLTAVGRNVLRRRGALPEEN